MKRTKIANYLKLLILFFGVSLLLFNCEKDEIIVPIVKENTEVHKPYAVYKKKSEIPEKIFNFI
ncbi:MAG: hypothetical protein V3V28_12045, partial [Polaribacter sp.]|uniref:hypothetical protein n=1 Tax=Polaribacter sp. TaxID=1920175 RepID=UPI002F35D9F9